MVSGAALAIEDAVVLAEEVTRHDDLAGALSAYEERRLDRARTLVATSLELARCELEGRRDEFGALMGKGHAAMAAPI
jgi:2-polyprenyl-6-methoxyphenol hydroxylase-like FAD-dependent oxidoreductase